MTVSEDFTGITGAGAGRGGRRVITRPAADPPDPAGLYQHAAEQAALNTPEPEEQT
jgi:hypothetical protein